MRLRNKAILIPIALILMVLSMILSDGLIILKTIIYVPSIVMIIYGLGSFVTVFTFKSSIQIVAFVVVVVLVILILIMTSAWFVFY